MAVNFPNSPVTNETYTDGGRTWRFDGTSWVSATPLVASAISDSTVAGRALLTASDAVSQRTLLGLQPVYNMFIRSRDMVARTTAGAGFTKTETATNRINYETFDFDTTTQEFVQFIITMPTTWTVGTIAARFYWTADSGVVGAGVVWALGARQYIDDSALTTALNTSQNVQDLFLAASDSHVSNWTGAITIGSATQFGGPIICEVKREPANAGDTLAVDARLLGVEITFSTT